MCEQAGNLSPLSRDVALRQGTIDTACGGFLELRAHRVRWMLTAFPQGRADAFVDAV
jgi:hypothetical protein